MANYPVSFDYKLLRTTSSGTFVANVSGLKLCRVKDEHVYIWDRSHRCEVAVPIDHLVKLANGLDKESKSVL